MSGGGATWHEDQLVPVTRYGKREDVWWTYVSVQLTMKRANAVSAACWLSAKM